MSDHTPAPWTIEYDHATNKPELIRAPFDGEMLDVASVLCSETGNLEADARLISAAPDLLEALERCTEILWDMTGYLEECRQEPEEQAHQAMKAARAAIHKATGAQS